MLTRCLIQSLKTSHLPRSSMTIQIVGYNSRSQLINGHHRNLTNTRVRLNEQKKSDNLYNFERLKEKLKTKTSIEKQNLLEFEKELAQLGLYQKFKKIISEYYHVIIVVHTVTYAIWFAIMCLVKYQFEITPEPLLQFLENYELFGKFKVTQFIFEPLKNQYFGLVAVPFFLCKCVTPIRYYTTIVGSMTAIRVLMPKGIIAPRKMPKIIQKIYGKYKKK